MYMSGESGRVMEHVHHLLCNAFRLGSRKRPRRKFTFVRKLSIVQHGASPIYWEAVLVRGAPIFGISDF